MTWRALTLAVAMTLNLAGLAESPASAAHQASFPPGDAEAISQFDAAIAKYLALRKRLLEEVPGPVPESSAPKLTQATDALAAAIQRSRPGARSGDLFVTAVTPVIKRRVVDAVQQENLAPVLAGIDDEQPGPATPRVHMRFPAAAPLATMPPSLLAVLPTLPKELEYRIVGSYLILRDVDAALILDVMPAAVPRQQF